MTSFLDLDNSFEKGPWIMPTLSGALAAVPAPGDKLRWFRLWLIGCLTWPLGLSKNSGCVWSLAETWPGCPSPLWGNCICQGHCPLCPALPCPVLGLLWPWLCHPCRAVLPAASWKTDFKTHLHLLREIFPAPWEMYHYNFFSPNF